MRWLLVVAALSWCRAESSLPFKFMFDTDLNPIIDSDGKIPLPGDDENIAVQLEKPIVIGDGADQVLQSLFQASYNGGIFSTKPYRTINTNNPWNIFPELSFLGLWDDIRFDDLRCFLEGVSCGMYVQKTLTESNLEMIENIIGKDDFSPDSTRTFIVTWYMAPSYKLYPTPGRKYAYNTFQMALTSDGTQSYAIYSYENIEYPLKGDHKAGFFKKKDDYCPLYKSNILNGHLQMTCQSNVGRPGTYVLGLTASSSFKCGPIESPDLTGRLASTCSDCETETDDFPKCSPHVCSKDTCKHGICQPDNTCACYDPMKMGENCDQDCPEKDHVACIDDPCNSHDCSGTQVCKATYCGKCDHICIHDPCLDNPCPENGKSVCVHANNQDGYECKCPANMGGPLCQTFQACEGAHGCEDVCDQDETGTKKCFCQRRPTKKNNDSGKCEDDYLLVGNKNGVFTERFGDQNRLHLTPGKHEDILWDKRVGPMLYFPGQQQLMYVDLTNRGIYKYHIGANSDMGQVVKAQSDTQDITSFAYDNSDEHTYLFWSEDMTIYLQKNGQIQDSYWMMAPGTVRQIVLLPEFCRRTVIWLVADGDVGIYSASMIGDNPEPTVLTSMAAVSMTVNHDEQKIYFVDESNNLYTMNYDGSCTERLDQLSADMTVDSMTVFDQHIYMTTWAPNSLVEYNLDELKENVVAWYSSRPYGVAVKSSNHEKGSCDKKPECVYRGNCKIDNGGCQEICETVDGRASCSCKDGGPLAEDGKTCHIVGLEPFMYVSMDNAVVKIMSNGSKQWLYGFNNMKIISMSHDFITSRLFYTEYFNDVSTIYQMDAATGDKKKELFKVNQGVYGLVYHRLADQLFYSVGNKVMAYQLNDGLQYPLFENEREGSFARGLEVNECDGLVFMTFWNENGGGQIIRFDRMDGNIKVIADDLIFPNDVTIDHVNKKLYWADAKLKRIERSNLDGSCRQLIHFVPDFYPFGVQYHDGYVYWTNWVGEGTPDIVYRYNVKAYLDPENLQQVDDEVVMTITSRGFSIKTFMDPKDIPCVGLPPNCVAVPEKPVNPINENFEMLPFDPAMDTVAERADDGNAIMEISSMPLFDNNTRYVFINTNGMLTFGKATTETEFKIYSTVPTIAPFALDLNNTQAGDIYYRQEFYSDVGLAAAPGIDQQQETKARIQQIAADYVGDYDFKPRSALIVTWNLVPEYQNPDKRNTFQCVLTTDGSKTLAMMLYHRLDSSKGKMGYVSGHTCNRYESDMSPAQLQMTGIVAVEITSNCTDPTTRPTPITGSTRPTPTTGPTGPTPTTGPPQEGILYPYGHIMDYSFRERNVTVSYEMFQGDPFFKGNWIGISTNGFVSTDEKPHFSDIKFPHKNPLVAAYAYQFQSLNATNGTGDVFVRTTRVMYDYQDDLQRIHYDVARTGVENFYPQEAIVITYVDRVPRYFNNDTNTFQLVLATDYKSTYAIFNYKQLELTYAVAAFSMNEEHYYVLIDPQSSDDLEKKSNVEMPGRHVYRIDKGVVEPEEVMLFEKRQVFGTPFANQEFKGNDVVFSQMVSGTQASNSYVSEHIIHFCTVIPTVNPTMYPDSTPHGGSTSYPDSTPHGGSTSYPDSTPHGGSTSYPDSTPHGGSTSYPDSTPHGGSTSHPDSTPYDGSTSYPDSTPHDGSTNYPDTTPYPYTDSPDPTPRTNYTTYYPGTSTRNPFTNLPPSTDEPVFKLCPTFKISTFVDTPQMWREGTTVKSEKMASDAKTGDTQKTEEKANDAQEAHRRFTDSRNNGGKVDDAGTSGKANATGQNDGDKLFMDAEIHTMTLRKDAFGLLMPQPHFQVGGFDMNIAKQGCQHQMFPVSMTGVPVVKLQVVNMAYNFQAHFPLVYMTNVTRQGFTVCYASQMLFSAGMYATIRYMAATNASYQLTEVEHHDFPLVLHEKDDKYCQAFPLKHRYEDAPSVFVQAELVGVDTYEKPMEVLAWVADVKPDIVRACVRNNRDSMGYRVAPVVLHMMVAGKKDNCTSHMCPDHLTCYVDGYSGEPYCDCIKDCSYFDDKVCASDMLSYSSRCKLNMHWCRAVGKNATKYPSVVYEGECKYYPYQTGTVELENVPEIPVAFCKYVSLKKRMFNPSVELQVLLTVQWTNASEKMHDASAVWSEDVSLSGFKTCVLISGRHYFEKNIPPPTVHWIAAQRGAIYNLPYGTGGSVPLPTWYAGSQCAAIQVDLWSDLANSRVFVSVEHKASDTFTDAMTAWVEPVTRTHQGPQYYRICARELQNFDGKHEGVKLHWVSIPMSAAPYVSLTATLTMFPTASYQEKPAPSVCVSKPYDKYFPRLESPRLLMTAMTSPQYDKGEKNWSENDLTAWIEHDNGKEATLCYKSVQNAEYQKWSTVNVAVFPKICDDGWFFYSNSCYISLDQQQSKTVAEFLCKQSGGGDGRVPVSYEAADDLFLTTIGIESTWLGIGDKENEGMWVTEDGKMVGYQNWGAGVLENNDDRNCAVLKGGKWHPVDCASNQNIVCVKDANLMKRSCSDCINGDCYITRHGYDDFEEVGCQCHYGYSGKWCQEKVDQSYECTNYTMLGGDYRIYTGLSESSKNETCDSHFANRTMYEWIRFLPRVGGRMLDVSDLEDSRCIQSTHHCGVKYPGWLSEKHPNMEEGIVEMLVHFYSYYCASDMGTVDVRNCGDFPVYRFTKMPSWSCDYGLCTAAQ